MPIDEFQAVENNIPIDGQHYIDHQLKQPLMRIFENILPNAEAVLFTGEHMRKVIRDWRLWETMYIPLSLQKTKL